jgi:hypothetical protein
VHELYEVIKFGGPFSLLGAVIGGLIAYFRHDKEGGEHVVYGALAGAAVPIVLALLIVAA